MPSSDEGEIGYIVLNTIAAIFGLLFTSILIGVVSSGIETKLEDLREGNTYVVEENHTVILGYNMGEHGLLEQLIMNAKYEKLVIVIFSDNKKTELEQDIKANINIPKNVEVLCRNGDITDLNAIQCCAIDKAKLIIVNALNDNKRIKAILAVVAMKMKYPECNARVLACVTSDKYILPKNGSKKHNVSMFKTDDFMAKIIAHTATEPGLSIVFKELLNFEYNEFYFENDEKFVGKSIFELTGYIDRAIIAGIKHDGRLLLNPSRDVVIHENDELILVEEEKGAYKYEEKELKEVRDLTFKPVEPEEKGNLVIFGNNVLLGKILSALPDDIKNIIIVAQRTEELVKLCARYNKYQIWIYEFDEYEENYESIIDEAEHIILLTDREIDKEDADSDVLLLLLKLRDLKQTNGYDFNFAAELNLESTHNVAIHDSTIDYIVSSNIASLVLAQMSNNPELEGIFDELLSREGNELFSKSALSFNLVMRHDYKVRDLKRIILTYNYVLLGFRINDEVLINPINDTIINFNEGDRLFVLGLN